MAKQCPACGKAARGKFCSNCGTALADQASRRCAACSNEIPAGGRFCNMCGTPVDAAPPPAVAKSSRRGLLIGGGAVLAAALTFVLLQVGRDPEPAVPPLAPAAAPAAGPGAIDLSQMSPREAADRLFDRVMRSVSAGDSVSARQFAPMALAAYEMVPDLDLDGRYHVAVLHLVNGDAQGARAAADVILAQVPTHLFGLYTKAQAEALLGNTARASELYRQFLEHYDAEVATGRPEYREHQPVLPAMREEAVRGE
jgi:hypothetical protein